MRYQDGDDIVVFWDPIHPVKRQEFISEFIQKTHPMGEFFELRLEMLGAVDGFEFVHATVSGLQKQEGVLYAFGSVHRG